MPCAATKFTLTPWKLFVTLKKHLDRRVSVYQQIDVDRYRTPGPSFLNSITELPRVMLELTSLLYSWPWLAAAPRGDGHRVLVLPGFTGGDDSTLLLRRYLNRLGYDALPWELGRNTGSVDLQDRLVRHVRRLTEQCDGRMSIVGQSLGGVFARELSREFAPRIRQVICLGSPFSSTGPENTHSVVGQLFQRMSGMTVADMEAQLRAYASEPPPVPSTAIYSKSDGVVHWSACLEFAGAFSENIEVVGSHTGMSLNPLVFQVLADRLAQPDGAWRPFERRPGMCSLLYPVPEATVTPAPTSEASVCVN